MEFLQGMGQGDLPEPDVGVGSPLSLPCLYPGQCQLAVIGGGHVLLAYDIVP